MIFQCSTLPGCVSMGFANGPVEVASISSLRAPGIIHQTCHRFRCAAELSEVPFQLRSNGLVPANHAVVGHCHGIQSWNMLEPMAEETPFPHQNSCKKYRGRGGTFWNHPSKTNHYSTMGAWLPSAVCIPGVLQVPHGLLASSESVNKYDFIILHDPQKWCHNCDY